MKRAKRNSIRNAIVKLIGLEDRMKRDAEQASAAIDKMLAAVEASNERIAQMERHADEIDDGLPTPILRDRN